MKSHGYVGKVTDAFMRVLSSEVMVVIVIERDVS